MAIKQKDKFLDKCKETQENKKKNRQKLSCIVGEVLPLNPSLFTLKFN